MTDQMDFPIKIEEMSRRDNSVEFGVNHPIKQTNRFALPGIQGIPTENKSGQRFFLSIRITAHLKFVV